MKRKLTWIYAVALFAVLLVCSPADAGMSWRQTGGPEGGNVDVVALDPGDSNTVYAGSYAGIFKSTDAGATWTKSGIPGGNIRSVLVDPRNSQTLFAASGSGIYKSTDGGASWSAINEGLSGLGTFALSLAFDPNDSQVIYAGTGDGVFKSTNGGAAWTAMRNGLDLSPAVYGLAIDPTDTHVVYAATDPDGVYKSTDGGASWSAVNEGLTNLRVTTVAVDPANSQTVYASAYDAGVFKSTDGGATWLPVRDGLTGSVFSIAIDNGNSQIIYAGTSRDGVFRSIDGGLSWRPSSEGPSYGEIQSLAIAPDGQTVFAASYGGGVTKSVNGGQSWSAVNNGLVLTPISSLTVDTGNAATVYAGTRYGAVFKSGDGGGSWSALEVPNPSYTGISVLKIDPSDSRTIYAGGAGIFRSSDGGNSWSTTAAGPELVQSLAVAPETSQVLYAGTWDQGIFKSSDGGTSWNPINDGLSSLDVKALAIPADGSETVYAGTASGFYKSSTGGASWSRTESLWLAEAVVLSLAVDPHSRTIYAGTAGEGVFRSADGGVTWDAAGEGVPSAATVKALAVEAGSHAVYAALTDLQGASGIFKSSNGGVTWSTVKDGLTETEISAMALDNQLSVYAGTLTEGVWKAVPPLPTISGDPPTTVTAESSYSFTPSATDAASFSIAAKPSWATFDPATGALTGKPGSADVGTSSDIVISAGNGAGVVSLPAFAITVAPQPMPEITGTPAESVRTGEAYRFTPTARYATSFSISNRPDWASFNSATGELSGRPGEADVGRTDNIVISAGNPAGSVPLPAFSITVTPSAVSWEQTGAASSLNVTALAVDPVGGETIYAAADPSAGGVLKSSNGGSSWDPVYDGLTDRDVTVVAIDPAASQTIYAGTTSGVFKSTNAGVSWNRAGGYLDAVITAVAVDPGNSQTLYAGTNWKGVLKSTDGGDSWSAINTGLPSTYVNALAVAPGSQAVYAGTNDGVYKSSDGGGSWSAVLTWSGVPTPLTTYSLAIDRRNSAVFAGTVDGVYRSTDGGASWTALKTGLPDYRSIISLALDPNSQSIYAGMSWSGLYKSVDGGESWQQLDVGIAASVNVGPVAVVPARSQTIYVGIYGRGMFKSTNGGKSWSSASNYLHSTTVLSLGIDPGNSQTIFAGTERNGILKSYNGGGSWSTVTAGVIDAANVRSVTVDRSNSQIIYAGMSGGAFKSINGGTSWFAINNGLSWYGIGIDPVYPLVMDPANSRTLYAGTAAAECGCGRVYRSSDGGYSWTALNGGVMADLAVYALAIDPRDSRTIYALAGPLIFKSTDAGASWSFTYHDELSTVSAFALAPSQPQTMYAGISGGVLKSSDGGVSWSAGRSGFRESLRVLSLAVDRFDSQTVYAGTDGGGVYMTADGGDSWSAVNSGLSDAVVHALAIDPADRTIIYAGTGGSGIFKGRLTLKPPTIGGTPGTSITAGQQYSFTPLATGAVSFSIVNKPSWANFDPDSGALSGTPVNTNAATFSNIVISATNGKDAVSLEPFAITVQSEKTVPVVRSFTLATPVKTLAVPITALTAEDLNDPSGVTGYAITTTTTAPLASAAGWSATPPASYTFTSSGSKKLYAWARDSAGNVSAAKSATVTIDMTRPAISSFTVKAAAPATVPVLSFSASDSTGVTGYLITESPAVPDLELYWSPTPPSSYTTTSTGDVTLYGWTRDGAGNVSLPVSAKTAIDTVAPVIGKFTAPALVKSLSFPVSVTATDNRSVTGYLITVTGESPVPVGGEMDQPATHELYRGDGGYHHSLRLGQGCGRERLRRRQRYGQYRHQRARDRGVLPGRHDQESHGPGDLERHRQHPGHRLPDHHLDHGPGGIRNDLERRCPHELYLHILRHQDPVRLGQGRRRQRLCL